jgi:hypothetical protein
MQRARPSEIMEKKKTPPTGMVSGDTMEWFSRQASL